MEEEHVLVSRNESISISTSLDELGLCSWAHPDEHEAGGLGRSGEETVENTGGEEGVEVGSGGAEDGPDDREADHPERGGVPAVCLGHDDGEDATGAEHEDIAGLAVVDVVGGEPPIKTCRFPSAAATLRARRGERTLRNEGHGAGGGPVVGQDGRERHGEEDGDLLPHRPVEGVLRIIVGLGHKLEERGRKVSVIIMLS